MPTSVEHIIGGGKTLEPSFRHPGRVGATGKGGAVIGSGATLEPSTSKRESIVGTGNTLLPGSRRTPNIIVTSFVNNAPPGTSR